MKKFLNAIRGVVFAPLGVACMITVIFNITCDLQGWEIVISIGVLTILLSLVYKLKR